MVGWKSSDEYRQIKKDMEIVGISAPSMVAVDSNTFLLGQLAKMGSRVKRKGLKESVSRTATSNSFI